MQLGNVEKVSDCLLANAASRIPASNSLFLFWGKLMTRNRNRLGPSISIAFRPKQVFNYMYRHVELLCQHGRSVPAWFIELPNFICQSIRENRVVVPLPGKISGHDVGPPFVPHIQKILGICSEPQVRRINAIWAIPIRAIVTHTKTFWDWAKVKNPRGFMGKNHIASPDFKPSINIPVGLLCSPSKPSPIPTTRSDVHFLKEPAWKIFGKSLRIQILNGNLVHSSVLCASGLLAQRASLLCGTAFLIATVFSSSAQTRLFDPALTLAGQQAAGIIAFRAIGSNSTTTAASAYATTAANTISPNTLALIFVVSSLASATDPTSVTGCGLTWTKVTSTNYNAGGQRISLWRSMTNATTPSGTITANFSGNQTGCNIRVVELSDVDTSGSGGSGAIAQTVLATNATANPSITMAAFTGTRNAGVAFFANVTANGFAGTPEAGWTEDWDAGYNNPATSGYCEFKLLNTDSTPSVTVGAQQWAGVAVEVKVRP